MSTPLVEIERKASPTSRSRFAPQVFSWKFVLPVSLLFVAVIVFLQRSVAYDQSNYSAAFASAAQLLGASLAILISVFLVASQVVESMSPLALQVLPKATILGILFFESAVVGFDLLILVLLPNAVSPRQLLVMNIGLVLNLIAVLAVIPYGLIVVDWIRADSLIENLVTAARKDRDSSRRLEIIQSLEELALKSAERRQAHTCSRINRAYSQLSIVFATSGERDIEVIKRDTDHPMRKLQRSIGQIGEFYSDFQVEDAIPEIAWVCQQLTRAYDKVGLAEMLDVELSMSIQQLVRDCANHKQEWTIYNFWANMNYVIKEWIQHGITERSRILLYMLDTIEQAIIDCGRNGLHEAMYQIVETIESIVHFCRDYGYPTQMPHGPYIVRLNFREDLTSLIAQAEETCKSAGAEQFHGKYGNRMISEIIQSARKTVLALPVANEPT